MGSFYVVIVLFVSVFVDISYQENESGPFVISLAKDEYQKKVDSGERFIVNFVSPGCVKCNEFAPAYEEVGRYFAEEESNLNIKTYLESDLTVIRKLGLRRLPSVLYVRDSVPILYYGELESDLLIDWVETAGRVIHKTLTDGDFEHLTQAATGATTGDWMVLFCKVKSLECSMLIPSWESVAYRVAHEMNFAVVDTEENPKLVKRFNLPETPTMHLFRNGKRYPYTLAQRDDNALLGFVKNGYKQLSGINVPPPLTPFDELTDNIADQLKVAMPDGSASKLFTVVMPILIVIILLVFCLRRRSSGPGLPARTKKGV